MTTVVRVYASRPSPAAADRVRDRLDEAGFESEVARLDDGIEITFPKQLEPDAESDARGLALDAVVGRDADDSPAGSLRERVAVLEAEVERLSAIVEGSQTSAMQDPAMQDPAQPEP